MLNCRETTQKVLQGEDRRLPLRDRLAVKLHQLACDHCRRFERQVGLMRAAGARWRRYTEE
ncbi:MAG: hypothetical protein DI603_14775 [Roseateles depolymerans]|uniref:Zinc-finger domain-containing protein n=1 Tax=Roseateles depolymerans TaxID=76731 RepID=A0A2W5DHV8_9BURK|nr:MAG: hypothetical protein DI603_14775 [Roseateles depolymerans]